MKSKHFCVVLATDWFREGENYSNRTQRTTPRLHIVAKSNLGVKATFRLPPLGFKMSSVLCEDIWRPAIRINEPELADIQKLLEFLDQLSEN